jgi:hypothetical protein
MTNTSTRWTAGVREAPRHEIAGSRRRRNSLYGDYMSGGAVKPNFWVLFQFHPFFCST